jgi:hypothetical protein
MAARKFFINMGADPASALVESFTSAVTLGADDIAFFHCATGGGFLHIGGNNVTDAGSLSRLADDTDHGGHTGTGIVGDI